MLVSSFRVPDEINRSGWWTALTARENPAYTSLVQNVEFARSPIINRTALLEEAQAELDAGPTEANLAEARDELESPLRDAVTDAERELETAQAALDAGEEGAEDEVTADEEALAEAQAALDAGVSDDEVQALAIQELETAVTRQQTVIDNLTVRLEENQRALDETDEPESFALFSKGWREQWTTDNYEKVLDADGMSDAFFNSLLVTIPSVVIPITIAAFAAYAFAWLNFPFKDWLFALVIISMGVPLHLALVPILELYIDLDLGGTYMGVWLAHTGFGLPLAIYLIYGYMITVPRDIMESASIDGASMFTSFTRLVLPLSIPVIAAFAIFQFLWVWNDLLLALVFLGTDSDNIVLTAKLTELVGSKGQDWEVLTAGAFITMAMPLAIFFALQRFFVRGLTAGSVKG
jgi:alpha-glucoside transport system permease protein